MEAFKKILSRISVISATGENLKNGDLYHEIINAKNIKDSILYTLNKPRHIDWKFILNKSEEALINKSKDLQILFWYLEAFINLNGISNIGDITKLIYDFTNKFWDAMYPQDYEIRESLFFWYNKKLPEYLLTQDIITGTKLVEWLEYSDKTRNDTATRLILTNTDVSKLHNQMNCSIDHTSKLCDFLYENKISISFDKLLETLNQLKSCVSFILNAQAKKPIKSFQNITIDGSLNDIEINETTSHIEDEKDQTFEIDKINESNIKEHLNAMIKFMITEKPKSLATQIIKQTNYWYDKGFMDLLEKYSGNSNHLTGVLNFLELNQEKSNESNET